MKPIMIFISFLLLGCGSSKITSSWRAENIQPKKFNKIMVLGLIREADRTIREKMEQHFVGDLNDLGYNAIPSMSAFGPHAFRKMNKDSAVDLIRTTGADAVITIVLLDKSKEKRYVPGHFSGGINYGRLGDYYTYRYDRVSAPGYFVTDTKYFWESNLYDVETRQLVYSVQTQSFSPSSSEALGHEYGKLIVKDMIKQQALSKQ